MVIDLKELSLEDLNDLINKATLEKRKRSYTKDSIGIFDKFLEHDLIDSLYDEKTHVWKYDGSSHPNNVSEIRELAKKLAYSIYTLCDYSLGNYEIVECKNYMQENTFKPTTRKSSIIGEDQYLEYKEMAYALYDIFDKHYKRRKHDQKGGNDET